MNEETTNRLINELINVVKALNEKVGVPQPTEENLIVGNTTSGPSLLGINSEQILKISKNLGLSVPGLTAFKNLDWDAMLLAVESLDEMILEMVLMEDRLNKALTVSKNMVEVSGNLASTFGSIGILDTIGESFKSLIVVTTALGAAAGGLMIFGALSWETIAKGVVTLGGLAGVTVLLGTAKTSLIGVATLAALGLALIPVGYGVKQLEGVSWEQLAIAGTAIGGLAAIAIGLGVPAVALLAATGAGVMVLLSGTITLFGMALSSLFELPVDQLPFLGTSLKDFLVNMVSGIGILTGVKLAASIPLLLGIGGGLMAIATAVRMLMPVIPDFNNFMSGILNVDKANLAASAEFIVKQFDSVAESISRISTAINDINLDAVGNLATKIKDMSVNVINNNPEIIKTNNILSEQLTINRLQLDELRKQTMMLGNIPAGGESTISGSENFVGAESFNDTRRNYRASAYYLP